REARTSRTRTATARRTGCRCTTRACGRRGEAFAWEWGCRSAVSRRLRRVVGVDLDVGRAQIAGPHRGLAMAHAGIEPHLHGILAQEIAGDAGVEGNGLAGAHQLDRRISVAKP